MKTEIPIGKYILRATPPKSYFEKNKIKFPSISKAQDYATKISGITQTEKSIFDEAKPVEEQIKSEGGGYIIFTDYENQASFIFKVEGADNTDKMKVRCPRCEHEWDYKGVKLNRLNKFKQYVVCPICHTTVKLESENNEFSNGGENKNV